MKKILVVMIGALTLICTLNACALPHPGEVQVISSPEPSPEDPSPSPTYSDEAVEPLTDDEIGELIEEGVIPQDTAGAESGDTKYDEEKAQALIEAYRENVECTATILTGNNMIVQVKNKNNVTIPKLTITLGLPEGKHELIFYQVGAGRDISIPIEKKRNELPPAVDTKVSVSMAANGHLDMIDKINVSIEQHGEDVRLAIQNGAEQTCAMLSITVKFLNGIDMVYAQMQEIESPIEPGGETSFTFSLPEDLKEEGVTFDRIEYALNQAVA